LRKVIRLLKHNESRTATGFVCKIFPKFKPRGQKKSSKGQIVPSNFLLYENKYGTYKRGVGYGY